MANAARSQTPAKTNHGLIVPLITPLTKEGRLDEHAFRHLIDYVITGGAQGIFVLGTTGEGPSVPRAWRPRIVHIAAEQAGGRAQVYAGLIETSVADTYTAAAEYRHHGAVTLVASLPFYFPLSPDEQFDYFARLVETVELPVVLYDIPIDIHTPLDLAVIEHLRAFGNLVGIKDSSGDPARLLALLEMYADDSGFSVLVGATNLAGFGLLHGADGIVPSAANLEPGLCSRLYLAARKGDNSLVESLQREVDMVNQQYMSDGGIARGVARLKWLMSQRGLCGPKVLPPLEDETENRNVMKNRSGQ